jgi:ribonuclease HI
LDETSLAALRERFPLNHSTIIHPYDCMYTDGSAKKQDTPGGTPCTTIGAGVYDPTCPPESDREILVNPGGSGPSNTINRAELSAIHCALDRASRSPKQHVTILSDSQVSLQQLWKTLWTPLRMRHSKYCPLLTNCMNLLMIRAKRGHTTALIKTPAHIGSIGNERADKIAGRAADDNSQCTWTDTSNPNPYETKTWIGLVEPRGPDGEPATRYASNTNAAIKNHTLMSTCKGTKKVKTPGIYESAWEAAYPSLDLKHSSHALRNPNFAPHGQRMLSFRAKWGLIWNNKLAFRIGRSNTMACPLCNHPTDSTGHILAGCQHHDMHALYIKRHNIAVRIIAKAILRGENGGGIMIMDAGRKEDLPAGMYGTRVPQWLLPECPEDELLRMRPDILIIPTIPAASNPAETFDCTSEASQHTVFILEVGYCSDTRHSQKQSEKAQQHQKLADMLRLQGYKVEYKELHALSLGYAGSITKDLVTCLRGLAVSATKCDELCKALHKHALLSTENIVKARRLLERGSGS